MSRRSVLAAIFPAAVGAAYLPHPFLATTATAGPRPITPLQRGPTLSVRDFGVRGTGGNETVAVQTAVAAAIARAPCTLSFDGLTVHISIVDLSGASDVVLDGAGAVIMPVGQTGGRFTADGFGALAFTGFRFAQRAGWNYMPAIKLFRGKTAVLRGLGFAGCGFGAHVQAVNSVDFDDITLRQVGIYPRPRPLDPGANGFAAGFEIYGGGLRAAFCEQVNFGNAIDFRNDLPAGGHLSDRTGGAGGCSTLACNNVVFGAGQVVNAPGQGFCAVGEWQSEDVVGLLMAGRFDERRRGRRVVFRGSRASGCNQEGCTAFGMTDVRFEDVESSNNRHADIEIWLCLRAQVSGGRVWEDPSASHPLRNFGKLGGRAAVHIMDSSDVLVERLHCLRSRHNGIDVGGSRRVTIRDCTIDDYGQDDGVSYLASGVVCTGGTRGRIAEEVAVGPGNSFARTPMRNNRGADLFAQDPRQQLYAWNNSAGTRAVSFVNAPQAFRNRSAPFRVIAPAAPL